MRWTYLVLASTILVAVGCSKGSDSGRASPSSSEKIVPYPQPKSDVKSPFPPPTQPGSQAARVIEEKLKADRRQAEKESKAAVTHAEEEAEAAARRLEKALEGVAPKAEPQPDAGAPQPPVKAEELGRGPYTPQQEAATLVKPGDALPDLAVADLDGKEVHLNEAKGDAKVMVVVFWDPQAPTSELELEYLEKNLAGPWASASVKIVGVLRGDDGEEARKMIDAYKLSFPMLVDSGAKAFGQLATSIVPRTYVVDSAGKVQGLWIGFQGRVTIDEIRKSVEKLLQ